MPQLPLHSNRVESALREMRAVGVTEVVKSELGQSRPIELRGVRRFVEPTCWGQLESLALGVSGHLSRRRIAS